MLSRSYRVGQRLFESGPLKSRSIIVTPVKIPAECTYDICLITSVPGTRYYIISVYTGRLVPNPYDTRVRVHTSTRDYYDDEQMLRARHR